MKGLVITALALLVPTIFAWAQPLKLEKPFPVKLEDGTIIDVQGYGYAAPFYADIDGDSVPDLLVGEFNNGTTRIYHNYGTAHAPVFRDFKFLEANGEQAVIPPS